MTTQARARHTAADFLAFLGQVGRAYRPGELAVVLDKVSSRKTPAVRGWLEAHRRVSFHCTRTSASWMNQIEIWFGILSRQAIRQGSFRTVTEMIAMINAFTASWNEGSTPFAWVKTADQILAKAVRKPSAYKMTVRHVHVKPIPPASSRRSTSASSWPSLAHIIEPRVGSDQR